MKGLIFAARKSIKSAFTSMTQILISIYEPFLRKSTEINKACRMKGVYKCIDHPDVQPARRYNTTQLKLSKWKRDVVHKNVK